MRKDLNEVWRPQGITMVVKFKSTHFWQSHWATGETLANGDLSKLPDSTSWEEWLAIASSYKQPSRRLAGKPSGNTAAIHGHEEERRLGAKAGLWPPSSASLLLNATFCISPSGETESSSFVLLPARAHLESILISCLLTQSSPS